MDWFPYATGALGALFGGYGAWRAWSTDRRVKALGPLFEWQEGPDKVLPRLVNRMPHAVWVRGARGPKGHLVREAPDPESGEFDEPVFLRPNEEHQLTIIVFYENEPGPITVLWSRSKSGRTREWRGYLPAV